MYLPLCYIVDVWNVYKEFEHLRSPTNLAHGGIVLSPGRSYRIVLKLCAGETCYSPLRSNGLTVLSRNPSSGTLSVIYNELDLIVRI